MTRYIHNEREMAHASFAVEIHWPNALDHQPKITEHRFNDAGQAQMFLAMCRRDGDKAVLRKFAA